MPPPASTFRSSNFQKTSSAKRSCTRLWQLQFLCFEFAAQLDAMTTADEPLPASSAPAMRPRATSAKQNKDDKEQRLHRSHSFQNLPQARQRHHKPTRRVKRSD